MEILLFIILVAFLSAKTRSGCFFLLLMLAIAYLVAVQ